MNACDAKRVLEEVVSTWLRSCEEDGMSEPIGYCSREVLWDALDHGLVLQYQVPPDVLMFGEVDFKVLPRLRGMIAMIHAKPQDA